MKIIEELNRAFQDESTPKLMDVLDMIKREWDVSTVIGDDDWLAVNPKYRALLLASGIAFSIESDE